MEKNAKFSDLDKRRLGAVIANSKCLTMALQLLEANCGRQIVTKLIAQSNHNVKQMSLEELADIANQLDKKLDNSTKKRSSSTKA